MGRRSWWSRQAGKFFAIGNVSKFCSSTAVRVFFPRVKAFTFFPPSRLMQNYLVEESSYLNPDFKVNCNGFDWATSFFFKENFIDYEWRGWAYYHTPWSWKWSGPLLRFHVLQGENYYGTFSTAMVALVCVCVCVFSPCSCRTVWFWIITGLFASSFSLTAVFILLFRVWLHCLTLMKLILQLLTFFLLPSEF